MKRRGGNRLTKVDDTSLGGIVRSLQLRDVDNMPAHRRRRDEAAVGEVLELVAIGIGALELLAAPDLAGRASAEEGAVKVGGDDLVVVGDLAADGGALGPGDAGVGNEDVEAAVELLDDFVDDLLDVGFVGDVDLVGLA